MTFPKLHASFDEIGVKEKKLTEVKSDPTKMSQVAEIRNSILSEDGSLKFEQVTSLKKIVMAKIVSTFWTNQDTQRQIVQTFQLQRHPKKNFRYDFSEIKRNIDAKVS